MFFCQEQWLSFPRQEQRRTTWAFGRLFFKSSRSAVRGVFAIAKTDEICEWCLSGVRARISLSLSSSEVSVFFLTIFCFDLISGTAEHGSHQVLAHAN